MSIGLYIVLAPLYLKSVRKLQEKRFVFVKILAIIIPENGAKVSKIKCFQFAQQTLKSLQISAEPGVSQIDQVINFIQKNIHQNVTRTEIAHQVYMNPEYLSRLFKKVKGISLSDYIVQEKLKIAISLLEGTNLPVSVIATNIGYTNFSYFTQVFKKVYGISPSEYRQKKK